MVARLRIDSALFQRNEEVIFAVANLAVFFVATQLFGDLFVLLLLGLVAGFFLATPVLAERERAPAGVPREPMRTAHRTPVAVPGWARRAGRL